METIVIKNDCAAAWTIIQACCESVVMAELLGDRLIAQLAGAAALAAAERLGIPERELRRIQQLMARDLAEARLHPLAVDHLLRLMRRASANQNAASGARLPRRAGRPPIDESL